MYGSLLLSVFTGYLVGSIPTALLIGKAYGIDILNLGSKNMGATNVRRLLGWKPALLVLTIDVGKGALAAGLGLYLFGGLLDAALLSSLAAVLGHSCSLFVRIFAGQWRGGRGVATALGALTVVAPASIIAAALTVFLAIFLTTRLLPLSVLSAATTAVLSAVVLYVVSSTPAQLVLFVLLVFLLLVVTHRSHIVQLIEGKAEPFEFRAMPLIGGDAPRSTQTQTSDLQDRKIQNAVSRLNLPEKFDLALLVQKISTYAGRAIDFEPCSMPEGVTGGVIYGERIRILYDAHVSPLHQVHIKLHELGHIALDHRPRHRGMEDQEQELLNSFLNTHELYTTLAKKGFFRHQYLRSEDQEAELFATSLLPQLNLELQFADDPLVDLGLA